ncbi:MAG: Hsp20 family protein [candidate division Zixibacteria bacterium]|nr:Hsp20 family protein [candidate division Zixibacteria bacterium]
MTLIRWRPYRSMESVQDEVNKVFDSFFGTPAMSGREDAWTPDVDIIEDKDSITVNVDIPGMKKDDIKVSVHDQSLTIRGERRYEKEDKDKNYHRTERMYGAFSRTFSLPSTVEGDRIKANYKDGVLKIELPKVEEVKPKEIPISVG